jgi:O-succinylbenzoate synthase
VPSGLAVGIYDTAGELVERVGRYVSEGYRRVKIKIQPGWSRSRPCANASRACR